MPTLTPEEAKDQKPNEPDRQKGEKANQGQAPGKELNESHDGKAQDEDHSKKSESTDKHGDKKEEEKKPAHPATRRLRALFLLLVHIRKYGPIGVVSLERIAGERTAMLPGISA